jgi:ketosteroid isomerase-like protein
MKRELIDRVRAGLDGWLQGDTMPLEKLLHPDVELLWWKTGEWDSHGKAEVLALIKQRAAQRGSGVTIDVIEAGDDALVVTRAGPPSEGELPATLVTFADGLIIKMHQFRSADEALKAAPWRSRT